MLISIPVSVRKIKIIFDLEKEIKYLIQNNNFNILNQQHDIVGKVIDCAIDNDKIIANVQLHINEYGYNSNNFNMGYIVSSLDNANNTYTGIYGIFLKEYVNYKDVVGEFTIRDTANILLQTSKGAKHLLDQYAHNGLPVYVNCIKDGVIINEYNKFITGWVTDITVHYSHITLKVRFVGSCYGSKDVDDIEIKIGVQDDLPYLYIENNITNLNNVIYSQGNLVERV